MEILIGIVTFLISSAVMIPVGMVIRKKAAESKIAGAESEAKRILDSAKKDAENARKEEVLRAKEEALKARNELDKEIKERRNDIQVKENRLMQKEETIEKRSEMFERKEKDLDKKYQELDNKKKNLEELQNKQMQELQRISGLSKDEAKSILLEQLDRTLGDEKAVLIKEAENKVKDEVRKSSREMLAYAIQKCAADHTSETTVSVVALPNDDMKGRIIGREGRNIKALETLTGIDLIIDDTPEAVILSGFDPLRREVAKIALEKLIEDRKNSSS